MRKFYLNLLPYTHIGFYEGEDGGDAGGAGDAAGAGAAGGDDKGAGGAGDAGSAERKFTQKEVDNLIQRRVAKEKTEKQSLISQLESIRSSANLTNQQKEELEARIEELNSSMLSTKEQAARAEKLREEKFARESKKFIEERDHYKTLFTQSTIARSLSDAASVVGAEKAEQIQMMFGHSTYLSQDKDSEGKEIPGRYTPRMKFQGYTEEDGKKSLAELDLPVNEALAKLREDGLHPNLFKRGGAAGTGSAGASGKGAAFDPKAEKTLADFGGDQRKFAEYYQERRKALREAKK